MADKSVSIPERAREIAARLLGNDVTCTGNTLGGSEYAMKELTELAEAAMRSEREVCIEQVQTLQNTLGGRSTELQIVLKFLRDGGK